MCFTVKVMQPKLHNSGWEWPWLVRLWCVHTCGLHTALWSQGNEHCRPVICSRWCSFIYFIVCLGTPCLLLRSIKVLYGGQQIFRRIHIRLMDCSQITSSKRGIHKKCLKVNCLCRSFVFMSNFKSHPAKMWGGHHGVIRRNVNKLGAAQNVNRCIYKGRGSLPRPR